MDLCEAFNIGEKEEFKIEGSEHTWIINKNTIYYKNSEGEYNVAHVRFNDVAGRAVTKVLVIQLTEDEKAIFRNIDPRYKWVTKDIDGNIRIFEERPMIKYGYWYSSSNSIAIRMFINILEKYRWNMGPLYIDDYVER